MRRTYLFAVIAALAGPMSGALASGDEIADGCKAFAAENGTDASGCDCLGKAAADDPALFEELMLIASREDMDAAPPFVREAVAACFPEDADEDAPAVTE